MSTSTNEIHFPSGRHSSNQLSHLCRACESVLTRDDLETSQSYPHHSSLEDLIEAKRMDCYVCSYLFKSLDSMFEDIQEALRLVAGGRTPDNMVVDETCTGGGTSDLRADLVQYLSGFYETPDVSFTGLQLCLHTGGNYLTISIRLNPSYEGYFPLNTIIYDDLFSEKWEAITSTLVSTDSLIMIVPDKAFTKLFPTTLPSNTGSMETWSTVNNWVTACSQYHNCMAQVNSKWYPTRLVESMSNKTFRIIHSDSISQPGQRYITLSHRWGSSEFIKLTTDNVSTLARCSPVSLLPKTFRESLVVAQRMNIRYIWIDSLCIIQSGDNGADWQREATEMANIYTNSFCNISADYGNNQTDGLFFERRPPFRPACMVYMKCKVTETFEDGWSYYESSPELLELRSGRLCHIMWRHGWFENVLKSPLNCRAWVMQERLLAPRVLHFLAGQVSWECGQILAWEKARWAGCGMGPAGSRIPSHRVLSEMEKFTSMDIRMERFSFDPPDSPYSFWYKLVERYSECGLTKQSDKLVAFSGVARRMALITGDQYVAGLWTSPMTGALGWYRDGDPEEGPSRQHSKEYYAPSFSWAAADGPVLAYMSCESIPYDTGLVTAFIKHRKKPLYSAITKTGRPKFNDEIITDHVFGPMTSPEVELRARGILRTCHRLPGHAVGEGTYWHDFFAPSKDTDSAIHLYVKKGLVMYISYDRNGDHEDAEANGLTYYFTIISWDAEYSQAAHDNNRAHGLLLKSVDPSMGRFKRIGYIPYMRQRGTHEDPYVSEFVVRLGNERNLPAWSYDEVTGEHVFYIV